MKELWLDDKLNFVEEIVEIMDLEFKQLRQSHIPIVKVDETLKEDQNLHGNAKMKFVPNIHIYFPTSLQVVENMDGYQDQDIGDIILKEPFCKASYLRKKYRLSLKNDMPPRDK
uniref:Uncharacterized protein n=1 Tax=Tanacetum cinerariifolium TaxID=118510 RepID=A0A699GUK9_TANCI|nr:hypothetical protein [Tanacetum cinerariifolium]